MSKRLSLYIGHCQRCGKPVTVASRSLYGLDSLKARIGIVCEACFSQEETLALMQEMGQQLAAPRLNPTLGMAKRTTSG